MTHRSALAGSPSSINIYLSVLIKCTNYYLGKHSQLFKVFALILFKKALECNWLKAVAQRVFL